MPPVSVTNRRSLYQLDTAQASPRFAKMASSTPMSSMLSSDAVNSPGLFLRNSDASQSVKPRARRSLSTNFDGFSSLIAAPSAESAKAARASAKSSLNASLEHWPALECSYAQLMDCDLIECCLSAQEDLCCDTSDLQEQMKGQFSRSPTSGYLSFMEQPQQPFPGKLNAMCQWMQLMEERIPPVDRRPFTSQQLFMRRVEEVERLRREIESRLVHFKNVHCYCPPAYKDVGVQLEHRFHRLLLRIMEWNLYLKGLHQPAVQAVADDVNLYAPDEDVPDELRASQMWIQQMEERIPKLSVNTRWSKNIIQLRTIKFAHLQQEVEKQSPVFADMAQRTTPTRRQLARDLESRYHSLLLRIFEWNFHLASLNCSLESGNGTQPEQMDEADVADDEYRRNWDTSLENDITGVPLSIELQSAGYHDDRGPLVTSCGVMFTGGYHRVAAQPKQKLVNPIKSDDVLGCSSFNEDDSVALDQLQDSPLMSLPSSLPADIHSTKVVLTLDRQLLCLDLTLVFIFFCMLNSLKLNYD